MNWRVLLTKRGFTLVEVFVAMVILGFGILGLITLQSASIQARAHAQRLTIATELTSALLDELMVADPSSLNDGSNAPVVVGGVPYTQSWVVENNTPASGLNSIKVKTEWSEKNKKKSVELSAVVVQ